MAKLPSVPWPTIVAELKKRRVVLTILGSYLVVTLLLGTLIYRFGWDQPTTRLAARVFPLPAARVNNEFIWLSTYYRRLAILEHYAAQVAAEQPDIPDDPEERKRQTLDQLIEITLLRQEARKAGITVKDDEIMKTYEKLAEANGGKDAFEKVLLNLYGLTPFRFAQEFIPEQLYQDKLQAQLFTQVHVRHIVIRDEAQAREVLEKAKRGDDFAELAKTYSQDLSTRDQGGDLGTIRRGQVAQAFEDAAFALKPGEITQNLVKTDFGYHIIKLEERTEGVISDKTFAEWLDEVTADAKVTRYVAKEPFEEGAAETPSPEPTPQSS